MRKNRKIVLVISLLLLIAIVILFLFIYNNRTRITQLFEPLDMDSVECTTDPQGISDGGNGFAMNVYDMAKIGELFLNNGVWKGEQIISEEWVRQSTTLQFDRSSGSADYGYQWWVRTFGNQNYDAYFAQGHWGQYIFVVPDLELVVVFTSHYEGDTSIYWQLMNDIVNACQ